MSNSPPAPRLEFDQRIFAVTGAAALALAPYLPSVLGVLVGAPVALLLPGYLIEQRIIRAQPNGPFALWSSRILLSAAAWVVASIAVGTFGLHLTDPMPAMVLAVVCVLLALVPRTAAVTVQWGRSTVTAGLLTAALAIGVVGIGRASQHISAPQEVRPGIAITTASTTFTDIARGTWTPTVQVLNGTVTNKTVRVRALRNGQVVGTTTVTVPADGRRAASLRVAVGPRPQRLALEVVDINGRPLTRPLTWNRPTAATARRTGG